MLLKEASKQLGILLIKLFVLLSILIGLSFLLYCAFNVQVFALKESHDDALSLEYGLFQNISIFIVYTVIAIIAWVQLGKIGDTAEVSYLFEFDKKWGSEELIIARSIIHKPYVECQKLQLDDAERFRVLGQYIINLSMQDNAPDDAKNFMYVLSLLNFFETVGYLYNRKNLKPAKINELMGQSIKFYYKVFESYIQYRRNKHDKESFHIEFQQMYESL